MDDSEVLPPATETPTPETTPAGESAAAAPAPAAGTPLAARLDAAVSAWIVDQVHNSPLARVTEAYNHLIGSLPALKARVLAILETEV
ncbi:MAG: hypothetical protein PW843_24460 [Azospirillaceae bacterium]|nr:hypothetical protein [Azospirillaceae bacterium]